MPTIRLLGCLVVFMWAAMAASAQDAITIEVDLAKRLGTFQPVWAWVGHDEPNYTYSDEGRALLTKLAQLSAGPVHDRVHNLLTSGDGTPALKWGSTNAFTRDSSGNPVYDWTIIERIFDAYKAASITPLVEIGFMPEALSTHPDPYQHHWPKTFATGWAYPPGNYDEWSELVYRWVAHMVERYGADEVAKWKWEVWNEPDIFYWHGTFEEYCKFYDYTVAAVKKALPQARVGGPASTSPGGEQGAKFLRDFLEHCVNGQNYATGKKGVPLDFISFHAKGRATSGNGHLELSIGTNLRDIDRGFAIIEEFPTLRQLPVILTESDPESCAACDATSRPENQFRLTSQYASYMAGLLHGTLALAERRHINLQGSVTWAFTFPGQPIFAGQRAFTTHDIDLPLLNAFRMFGMMKGERVAATSTGARDIDDLLRSSVRGKPDVNAVATFNARTVNVLVWNYHDNSGQSSAAEVRLRIAGLPVSARALLEHWRVDRDHSNSYTAWQSMGSPQHPSPTQHEQLKAAGQLQPLESPRWVTAGDGGVDIFFTEPPQGVSLLRLTW